MDKDEIIKQLLITIDEFRRENELLRRRITELESRLAQYENAHTPPSLRRGDNRKRDQNEGPKGKPGQPDKQVHVIMDHCPYCGTKLGDPFKIESKIIEEIPEPHPIESSTN